MKKKFLSLMMAAAVVATTSVSAFAAESDKSVTMPTEANIKSLDSEEVRHDVTITGKVQDKKGTMPTATFKVTVPTAANFTVNQAGILVGPDLTVKNEGTQAVKVLAQGFENVGTGDIKVIDSNTIATDTNLEADNRKLDRTNVSLRLEGDNGNIAYLAAGNNKSGVSDQPTLTDMTEEGVELITLSAGDNVPTEKTISLKGTAGSKTIDAPVSDTFKLTLKIKKA